MQERVRALLGFYESGDQFAVDAVDLLAPLVERGAWDKAGHGISFLRDTKTKRPQDSFAAALKNSGEKTSNPRPAPDKRKLAMRAAGGAGS
jgi:hypothetical protein